MAHFVYVRHAQTDWNTNDRFRGRADIRLNETGLDQARQVATRLALMKFDAVYASPLERTWRTAEIVAAPHELDVNTRAELLDIDYGDWQGKLRTEVDPAMYALWQTQPDRVQFPNGENLGQLRARLTSMLEELSAQHRDDTVLLVSHDIVMKVLLCVLIGVDNNAIVHFRADNASIHKFDAQEGQYIIRSVNDTAHLEGTEQ
jgi:probable phosphoglycerate mutase